MSLLGRAALLLALAAAIYAVVAAIMAHRSQRTALQRSAERAVHMVTAACTVAIGTMWVALLTDSFELRHVAEYTSSTLGWQYKVTALWGSQAGSLLLWAWIFTIFASVVIWTNRARNRQLMPTVVAVMMLIAIFFLGLLSFVTSPFETLAAVPDEGRGLNPQLQNFYMQIHPPTLYLGYVGLAIPFAFAIAALVTRRLDTAWIVSVRRWTIFSWLFLGVGILLGAKWAYETLGWGGYWAWDPVENAAFMPWLVATAFLHSVMVQERRGMLKVWNMVLVILTFTLCIFGTFLTRSGLIESVHAFGESTLGVYFLLFIAVILVGSLGLLVTRLDDLRSQHSLESYLFREAVFLFNNLLLLALCFAVLWGTMFPVLTEAVQGKRIVVGQGFYNEIAAPIGIALLALTGIGPLIAWRKASAAQLRRRFVGPLIATAICIPPLWLLTDTFTHMVAGGTIVVAVFVAACVLGEFWRAMRVRHAVGDVGWFGALYQAVARNRRRYGGYIVHLGVVVLFIGFAGSKGFTTEADRVIAQGQSVEVAGYTFTHQGARRSADGHVTTTEAVLQVTRGNRDVATMHPAIQDFEVEDGVRGSRVAVHSTPARDLYVVLTRIQSNGAAEVAIYVNPLVMWLWIAGAIMTAGGVVAAWPGRRRVAPPVSRPAAATTQGEGGR